MFPFTFDLVKPLLTSFDPKIFSVLFVNELKRCDKLVLSGTWFVLKLLSVVVDADMTIGDLGRMCEMSDVELENIAILSFTLFSDFSSLFRQLIGLCRPNVADLNGGFESTKLVISSKCCILRGTSGATIAVALLVACDLVKSIAMLLLLLSLLLN